MILLTNKVQMVTAVVLFRKAKVQCTAARVQRIAAKVLIAAAKVRISTADVQMVAARVLSLAARVQIRAAKKYRFTYFYISYPLRLYFNV